MMDFLPQALKDFIDTIFSPPTELLNNVVTYLNEISLVAGKGINLQNYFGYISYLPTSFQTTINSLISSIVFLAILHLVRAIMATYYNVKEGIKWW